MTDVSQNYNRTLNSKSKQLAIYLPCAGQTIKGS